jgi:hypothetical protein
MPGHHAARHIQLSFSRPGYGLREVFLEMDQHFCPCAFEPLRGLVQQLFTRANVPIARIPGVRSSAISFGRAPA